MALPDLNVSSKYDAMHQPESEEGQRYFRDAPSQTLDGMKFLDALPPGIGGVIGKNIYIIHPFFGRPRNFYLCYQNQLDFVAEAWKEICSKGADIIGEPDLVTPLLIYGESGFCRLIEPSGHILVVKLSFRP